MGTRYARWVMLPVAVIDGETPQRMTNLRTHTAMTVHVPCSTCDSLITRSTPTTNLTRLLSPYATAVPMILCLAQYPGGRARHTSSCAYDRFAQPWSHPTRIQRRDSSSHRERGTASSRHRADGRYCPRGQRLRCFQLGMLWCVFQFRVPGKHSNCSPRADGGAPLSRKYGNGVRFLLEGSNQRLAE